MKARIIVQCVVEREFESLDQDTIQNMREEVNDLPVGQFWDSEKIEVVD
jgi:hypothetical protein